MRVLVACEFSGIVRDAFALRGHDATSCDLLPTERPGHHYQGDVRDVLDAGWDLLIAHPPCTYLAVSGARWFRARLPEQAEALEFVRLLLGAPIPRIALENPVSIISSRIRKPDQIVHPWQFGHGEVKATCLWLKGLPPLVPTDNRGWPDPPRPPRLAGSRPLEGAQPDPSGDRRRDGRAMGWPMTVYLARPSEPPPRTRTLPCVCGGTVRADRNEPAAGLRAHQRTNVHRAWRTKAEIESP